MTRNFYSWTVKPIKGLATGPAASGRLAGLAPVTITDLDNAAPPFTGRAPFELLGPGDVVRLSPATITRRFPAPGTADAEITKAPLVELAPVDLPWRYTPELDKDWNFSAGAAAVTGHGLRPWIVLVVGTPTTDGVQLTPDGRVSIGTTARDQHPLTMSWRSAHLHDLGGGRHIARILSPAVLVENTEYLACLVPAFAGDGNSWPAEPIACYDHWSFRTGPAGDFPELARLLQATRAEDLGPDFGTAAVHYDRRGPVPPPSPPNAKTEVLPTDGALTRVPDPQGPPPPALDGSISDEVKALIAEIPSPDGRPVLTAPRYHAPFTAPGTAPTQGWSKELASDPRRRAAAGLGAWAAVSWQERISSAAATKSGDLAVARDRIGHLALGLEAARSLWRRRLPADPVAKLGVLGPVLARLPAAGGGTVLDAIAGRTPLLTRSLWSSAARRALRHGPARSTLAGNGAPLFPAILQAANRCPPDIQDLAVIPPGDADPGRRDEALKAAIEAAGRRDPATADQVAARLVGRAPDFALVAAVLAALDPGDGRPPDSEALPRLLDGGDHPPANPADLGATTGVVGAISPPRPPCQPVDLGQLGRIVAGAVDPTVDRPVVVDRVLGTLPGLTTIRPVQLTPELDLPLWSFLRDNSPDWLLPGVGKLPEHRVVGVATNPGFVDTFLVGANIQTLGELRWRNVPITAKWSPLRKFWQRDLGAMDIVPIESWTPLVELGDATLRPPTVPPSPNSEAVVVFKTPLFRRYPGTVVYLYPNKDFPQWNAPTDQSPPDLSKKVDHTFTGTLADDIVFFGFPVDPQALANHWVVLEEPPAGFRFYREAAGNNDFQKAAAAAEASDYAYDTFAVPVRVMIGRLIS